MNIEYIPFTEAFITESVGKKKIKESEYKSYGSIKVVDQGQNLISGFTDRADLIRKDTPYIVFGDHTKIIKFVNFPFVTGADGVKLFKPANDFDAEYLFFFLKSVNLPTDGYGRHSKYLNELSIPKINPEKQRYIITRLKAQLAEVETARKVLEEQFSDVNLFVSRLKEQLLSKLQLVGRIDLGELIIGIEAGKSFKTLERLASDAELAVLKVSAVSWAKFNPQEAKVINKDYRPDDKHKVYKGDLIISRANTIELVGAVVRVDEDYPNRLLSDKTLRLVCNKNQVLPDYLLYALRWPEARLHIEANATGSSDSMRNISQKTIRTIPIPLPDKKTQQEIVDREKGFF